MNALVNEAVCDAPELMISDVGGVGGNGYTIGRLMLGITKPASPELVFVRNFRTAVPFAGGMIRHATAPAGTANVLSPDDSGTFSVSSTTVVPVIVTGPIVREPCGSPPENPEIVSVPLIRPRAPSRRAR